MHEADNAYSIWSTWLCYWLDQFLTLALNTLILSIFIFHWICLPSILLIINGMYVYNSSQYQLDSSVTCGLFAIYWIHEISKGIPYLDIVSRFDMNDLNKNK